MIRHELQIKGMATDLNEVVAKSLAGWEDVAGLRLEKDLQSLPKLLLDEEQMVKVVTNLVINAREAVAKDGQVRIATSQSNGWGVLTVSDNGCGMSPEFLNRSLFRPFQTTKKTGLGIGMFQSKMIVEAHGGRVEGGKLGGKRHDLPDRFCRCQEANAQMNPKLLIVDDDEEIRTALKWALYAKDYEPWCRRRTAPRPSRLFVPPRPPWCCWIWGCRRIPATRKKGAPPCPTCWRWIGRPRSSSSPARVKRRSPSARWAPARMIF